MNPLTTVTITCPRCGELRKYQIGEQVQCDCGCRWYEIDMKHLRKELNNSQEVSRNFYERIIEISEQARKYIAAGRYPFETMNLSRELNDLIQTTMRLKDFPP